MKYKPNMILYDPGTKLRFMITDIVMRGDNIICASIKPIDDQWPCHSVVTVQQLDKMIVAAD